MVIMNCNGVGGPSGQAAFLAALDVHRPDVVLGCESRLCDSVCICGFFPGSCTVFRRDRCVDGGFVFVAASDGMVSYEIPELDTDCGMV